MSESHASAVRYWAVPVLYSVASLVLRPAPSEAGAVTPKVRVQGRRGSLETPRQSAEPGRMKCLLTTGKVPG
jgi:hypothetical protein